MAESDNAHLPRHVGIIMDGNGRWARARGLHRITGHRQGAKTVDRVVTACRRRGIRVLTLYAFSSQNWCRPSPEVQALMELLGEYIRQERRKIMDNNIRLMAIGHLDRLPASTHQSLTELIEITKENTGMTLCLALSYGGREEILAAAGALGAEVAAGRLQPQDIDETAFTSHTWSGPLGPVDLIIRTSGEQRLSNFLLWSCAYAELHFTDRMWPEFDESDLDKALADFASRQRRYGDVTEHD